MDWENLKKVLSRGDFVVIKTDNSTHCGWYEGRNDRCHIPRVYLALSRKFTGQPFEKQCFDHIFSIDDDKIKSGYTKAIQ